MGLIVFPAGIVVAGGGEGEWGGHGAGEELREGGGGGVVGEEARDEGHGAGTDTAAAGEEGLGDGTRRKSDGGARGGCRRHGISAGTGGGHFFCGGWWVGFDFWTTMILIIMGMNESDSGTEMMGVWFRVCLCYLETQRKVHFVESGNSDFLFKECKEKKWN